MHNIINFFTSLNQTAERSLLLEYEMNCFHPTHPYLIDQSVILLACWFLLFLDWRLLSIRPLLPLAKILLSVKNLSKRRANKADLKWEHPCLLGLSFFSNLLYSICKFLLGDLWISFEISTSQLFNLFFQYLPKLLNYLISQNSFFIVLMKHCYKMSHFQHRADDATGNWRHLYPAEDKETQK